MLGRPAHPVFSRRPKDPEETPAPADKAAEAPKEDQPTKQKPKAA